MFNNNNDDNNNNNRKKIKNNNQHQQPRQLMPIDGGYVNGDNINNNPRQKVNDVQNDDTDVGRIDRTGRGIVEECCRKACTVAHLKLYCL